MVVIVDTSLLSVSHVDSPLPVTLVVGDNPLKSDPELVALLKKLDSITKYKYFHRWKQSFLDRLLPQILQDQKQSMRVADQASEKFDHVLAKTAKQAHKVVDSFGRGQASVKATLALRELGTLLRQTTDTLTAWIPASAPEEKRQGYTKFHLGAALIQHGFPQYITLKGMEDALHQIEQQVLPNTADRQLTGTFQAYHTQVNRFCDVMADLGMYEIMKKCWQFAVAPEMEESSDEEAMEIHIQGATMEGMHHSITVQVEPSETLGDVATTIEKEFGIPITHLVIKCKDKELPHQTGLTLGKAGVKDGATLQVDLRRMPLVVHVYGDADPKQIPIQVTCQNTLKEIKAMVEPASGIALPNQRIFRAKKPPQNELTDNQKTVQQYGFVDQEHLYLEPISINLSIQIADLKDKSFDVAFDLDSTSEDIQTKIARASGLEMGQFSTTPSRTTATTPNQHEDLPPHQTIRDMQLSNGQVLRVTLHKIPVIVKQKSSGATVAELLLHPTRDTLTNVKQQLHKITGIDPVQQKLYHHDIMLWQEDGDTDDSATPLSLGLRPHSILYLDQGPVEIFSAGEIYVSFTVKIKEAPNDREYKALALVTQDFYTKRLKMRYPQTFQSLQVECRKGLFEAGIPSPTYNVYVEWDVRAFFHASSTATTPGSNVDIPTRHALCSFLVQSDLSPYLNKVSKMPNKSFSKTCGVYTQQTNKKSSSEW